MTKARRRWPLETLPGNLSGIFLLGAASYALARWNVAPWAGMLHGLCVGGIAWCGCNVGVILSATGSPRERRE